jgi:hypothetical protein
MRELINSDAKRQETTTRAWKVEQRPGVGGLDSTSAINGEDGTTTLKRWKGLNNVTKRGRIDGGMSVES